MTLDELNSLCADIAIEDAEMRMAEYADMLEEEEFKCIEHMLADPRFYGPDADEGANDCDGLFYWELK
jgi:hypothetical protein